MGVCIWIGVGLHSLKMMRDRAEILLRVPRVPPPRVVPDALKDGRKDRHLAQEKHTRAGTNTACYVTGHKKLENTTNTTAISLLQKLVELLGHAGHFGMLLQQLRQRSNAPALHVLRVPPRAIIE